MFLHITISDVLYDLVPFAQLKKRENTHRGVLRLVNVTSFTDLFHVF